MAQSQRKKKNIALRRRLSDLYEKGEEVRFGAQGVVNRTKEDLEEGEEGVSDSEAIYPSDDDIVIFVTPPSPLQREMALREAAAARARYVLAAKRDEESPDSLQARASIVELDLDELVDFLVGMDENDHRQEAERNVLADSEWEDITELQDAMRQWAESDDPDDEKWHPLLARDLEFGQEVQKELDRLNEASRDSLKLVARPELEERAIKRTIEMAGNSEFMTEYQRWMFFYACRDGADHAELAFEHPSDLSDVPELVADALMNVYRGFIDSEKAAKNSPRVAPGSELSELPDAPETSAPSTPEEPTE